MKKTKSYSQIEDDFSNYPHDANPDSKTYTELILTKSSLTSHLLSTSGPNSHPLLAITVATAFSFKPTVTLHSDPTQTSTPLGIIKFGFWRKHNVGYCTNVSCESSEMEWLKLVRISMLSLKEFEFEYEGRLYVWTTIEAGNFGERPDMELREKEKASLLAFYKGERTKKKSKTARGLFFLKGKAWSEAAEMELGKWELVVLLTGLTDLEIAASEASRRKTAG